MTNFIEKLKQVAAGRTAGEWASTGLYELITGKTWGKCHISQSDLRFIALAANCFDELVACAEMLALYARSPNEGRTRAETVPMIDFVDSSGPARAALAALRQKVEGEV